MASASRSPQSLQFETAIRAASAPGAIPRLADLDFRELGDFAQSIALLHPDRETYTLKFVRAGAKVSQWIGREATGLDYLDFVDPQIRGDAFDATFVMLTRPCGLWQLTPGVTVDGDVLTAEYTGFPVFDLANGRGLIAFLVQMPSERPMRIVMVKHSTEWAWLELRAAPFS